MMNIAILKGGVNEESEVSLSSAENVVNALNGSSHNFKEFLVGEDLSELISQLKEFDLVMPILHGKGYEDGELQSLLEKHDIKYLGAGPEASELCFDKFNLKVVLADNNVTVPRGGLLNFAEFQKITPKENLVIKPKDSGSSYDLYIIRDQIDYIKYEKNVSDAFKRNGSMLVEELIEGVECTVGILGSEALPVVEIIPPNGEPFDYKNKYNGKTQELCPPKNLSDSQQNKIREVALRAHQASGARHFSRVDMIVDKDGAVVVLEINTIPGLTEESLFPKAAKQSGLEMKGLVESLINLAVAN